MNCHFGIYKDRFRSSILVRTCVCVICGIVVLMLLLVSCQRDSLYMKATMLQIELKRGETEATVVSKGAADDFAAEVRIVYDNGETKYNCFFGDPYNTGTYTIDYNRGDIVYASTGVPFHIVVETDILGQKLHGESEVIVIDDDKAIVVSIELYAGEFRIYTRRPRKEDVSGTLALVGGAIYELQDEQIATYAGVICAPVVSCAGLTDDNFTAENIQNLDGYCEDHRAFGDDAGIDGHSMSYLPFEVRLEGLMPETAYKIRAYAVVDDIVRYGQVIEFSTIKNGPTLNTLSATDVTKNSISVNAEVSAVAETVDERGFIVSHSRFLDNPKILASGSGNGHFDAVVSGLNPCTRIFYKAYAKTSYGTYYGELMSASTYDEFVDSRDNNNYRYVVIGSQKWLAENMRYLPQVSNATTGSEDDGSEHESNYYIYGYSGSSVEEAKSYILQQSMDEVPAGTNVYSTFGVLYNHNAAQTACPEGWHLPTDGEWTQLEIYLQNNGFNSNYALDCDYNRTTNNYIAKSLSSNSLWYSSNISEAAGNRLDMNNSSSMSMSPGGYRSSTGGFYGLSNDSYCWSATDVGGNAIGRSHGADNVGLISREYGMSEGLSVRCVKDN